MDIKQFRQQYPDYNDISDMDLATKLHAKNYSDIPFEEFASKFGIQSPTVGKVTGGQGMFGGGYTNLGGSSFGTESGLPKARLRDVPGIAGRGLASAELGVAKGAVGTLDAVLNIPSEDIRKVGTAWAPSLPTREEQIGATKGIKEAKSKIMSAQKKFDPKFSGALAWTTRTISEAVPYMANAAVAGAAFGPAGAFGVGFAVEGDYAYDDAIASGATEEQAQRERVVVGSLNAIIEALQVGRLLKFSEGGKHSLKSFVKVAREKGTKAAGKELKGWSGEVARLSIEEALEEFAQEGVSLGIPAAFRDEYPKKADGSPDWLAIGERLGGAALGGAVAAPIIGGAGRIGQGQRTARLNTDVDLEGDIPPGSNVYKGDDGNTYIETPAQMGDKTTQVTEERKDEEGNSRLFVKGTNIEVTQDFEHSVSGRLDAPVSETITPAKQAAEAEATAETPTIQMNEIEEGQFIDKQLNTLGEVYGKPAKRVNIEDIDKNSTSYRKITDAQAIADKFGYKMVWFSSAAPTQGFVHKNHPNIIFGNTDVAYEALGIIAHEAVHRNARLNQGSYQKVIDSLTPKALKKLAARYSLSVAKWRGISGSMDWEKNLTGDEEALALIMSDAFGKGRTALEHSHKLRDYFLGKGTREAALDYLKIFVSPHSNNITVTANAILDMYDSIEAKPTPAEATAETPAAPEQVTKPPRRSKTTLRAIGHKIARESNVSDEDYRDYAEVVTGKRSMKDMTRKQMEEFVIALEESFGSPTELTQEDFETPITVAGRGTTMGSVYRDTVAAVNKLAPKITVPDRIKLGFAKSKMTRQLRNFAYGIDNTPVYHLARILDGATNGIFSEVFDKGIQLGTKITDSHKRSTFGILRAGLEEAGVTNDDLAKMGRAVNPRTQTHQRLSQGAATEILVEKINDREYEMTWANLIDIYLMSNQEAGLRHLQEGGLVINGVETGALSDDWILDTMAKVESNEKAKAVADAIMKVGSDIWALSLNQVSNRLEGKDIATVEKWWGLEVYMPKKLKGKQRSGISLSTQKGINLIEDKGILKDRTRSGAALVVRDAFSRFTVFEDAVAEYVGMAEPTRTTRTLLNDPSIAKTLKQKGYDDVLNNIRKIHEAAQSVRPSEGGLTAFVERHLPALYRAALHANPPVIVSQATSTFNYGAYASPEFMASVKDGLSVKLCQETLALSDVAWARFHMGQSSLELGEMAKSDAALRMWTNKSADINKLGWGLKIGDLVALTGGMSVAQAEYQKALKGDLKGLSAEWWIEKNDLPEVDVEMWRRVAEEGENADPQERQAVEVWKQTVSERAEYLWQRTQPSWDKWNRSVITSQKGIARTFLLFRSFQEKCLTIFNEAKLDYDNSPKSLADKTAYVQKTGSVMASYTINMTLRLAILAAMTRKVKEPLDYLQDILTSWMGMFPVFGKVLEASGRTFIAAMTNTKPTYKGEALESYPVSVFNLALKTPVDFAAAMGHFVSGDNDKAETSFLKGMDDIFKGVGAIYGIPVYQIKRIMPDTGGDKTSAPTRRRVAPPVRRRP